jgi:hypothetical protein
VWKGIIPTIKWGVPNSKGRTEQKCESFYFLLHAIFSEVHISRYARSHQSVEFACSTVGIAVQWTWPVKAGRIEEKLDLSKGDRDRQQGLSVALVYTYVTEPHDTNSVNIGLSGGRMLWFLIITNSELFCLKTCFVQYKIWYFHGDDYTDWGLLGCDTV